MEAKFAELNETIEMHRKDGFDPAAKAVSSGVGKNIMDEIRDLQTTRLGFEYNLSPEQRAALSCLLQKSEGEMQ